MATSDKPGGHDREPPGKKPGGEKSSSNDNEDIDMSSDAVSLIFLNMASKPMLTTFLHTAQSD